VNSRVLLVLIASLFAAACSKETNEKGEQAHKRQEQARYYFDTEFYLDTGFVPENGTDIDWNYGEIRGYVTLVLNRGMPHSTVTTAHDWWERLSVELPSLPKPGKINVREAKLRVGFYSFDTRHWCIINDKGVDGDMEVISANEKEIVAKYAIVIHFDRYRGERLVEGSEGTAEFQGESTFGRRPRPNKGTTASQRNFSQIKWPTGVTPAAKK
jgi:hypothetical protein